MFERGGKHKGSSERSLLTARAKLATLLENEEVSSAVRTELEEVASLIRSVELHVGQKRLGELRLKHPSLDFLLQEEDDHIIDGFLAHRDQLLQLYTDCDLGAAEGNRALSPVHKSSGSQSHQRKRLSTQELDASVANVISTERAAQLLEQATSLDFDALAFADAVPQTIFVLFVALEERLRLVKHVRDLGQVSNSSQFHGKLTHFMEKIDHTYKAANPYHNSAHAADVVVTLEYFFRTPYLQARTSPLDHLITLIGGAIHDVGHPGQNNMFHAKTLSPLAIRYNDKSILENMHVSVSFEIMQSDAACNWFALLLQDFRPLKPEGATTEEAAGVNLQQYVRKALVQMILATDIAKHANAVQELKIFVEEQAETSQADESEQQALDNKLFTLDTILHAADISNPARPQPIMLKWTERLLREFWAQGDEEKRLGLPVSPLCDRETDQWAVPKGQLGFINFIVQPLYVHLSRLIPEVSELCDRLKENAAFWEEKHKAKATHEQIFAGMLGQESCP